MADGVIMVVDADRAVVDAMTRGIRAHVGDTYRVVEAMDADEALSLCSAMRNDGVTVALVIAGQHLGSMTGSVFLLQARAIHPDAGKVLLTSHSDVEAAIVAVNDVGIDRYLIRPWDPPEQNLYPALDELLADWRERDQMPYLRVQDIMTVDVTTIARDSSLARAAETVAATGVGDLMVVTDDGDFVGVLSEGDILRAGLPDLDEILHAGGTLRDGYQEFMYKSRQLTDRPMLPLVIRDPIVMSPTDHVAKAAVVLIDRQIRRLPVVEDGRLVGTVSRTNICQAVVGTW